MDQKKETVQPLFIQEKIDWALNSAVPWIHTQTGWEDTDMVTNHSNNSKDIIKPNKEQTVQ